MTVRDITVPLLRTSVNRLYSHRHGQAKDQQRGYGVVPDKRRFSVKVNKTHHFPRSSQTGFKSRHIRQAKFHSSVTLRGQYCAKTDYFYRVRQGHALGASNAKVT